MQEESLAGGLFPSRGVIFVKGHERPPVFEHVVVFVGELIPKNKRRAAASHSSYFSHHLASSYLDDVC